MKSPMIATADYIKPEEKGHYSELQVLKSAAGFYIGTVYHNPEGFTEPGSRDSDYYVTREEAEKALKALESNDDDNAPLLRMHP